MSDFSRNVTAAPGGLPPDAITPVNDAVTESPVQPSEPISPANPPLDATPAGDNPAGIGKQPDAVGRGDSSASSGSLADGSRGDAGAGSVGAVGAGHCRVVDGCLVAGG